VRSIGVVTVARSDYGSYRPILRRIAADADLRLMVFAGGMHLSPEFGLTVRDIERDGYPIVERIEMLLSSDSPEGVSKAIGLGVIGFAQAFARSRPDLLLVLGDRFEMFAAAAAALPFNIPLAHIHGGEASEGAIDEAMRHSLTKMSHLHFVSMSRYRDRVIQLGEEPWRVTVSGSPSLDHLVDLDLLACEALEDRIGVPLRPSPLLVTFHPVTLDPGRTTEHIEALLRALDDAQLPVIFTHPNADTQGRIIIEETERYVRSHANAHIVANLGTQAYFSLMRYARAMVGNSSSGIAEAASFQLPVVNVGDRQRGRIHGRNVIDVPCDRAAIVGAIASVVVPEFRNQLAGMVNAYGDGQASARIVERIKSIPLDRDLLFKRFYDLSVS
jgi:UDP-hydrolysing UDP-N-acetyl-D-glucosamine 2-epimerase